MEMGIFAGGQLIKAATSIIKEKAISRWSKYRADRFLEALVDAVRDERDYEVPDEELNQVLDKMMEKEANTEAVFEAYRRVCLSRSRDVGPRMIGILTAGLLGEERLPNMTEETILDVAEHFNDGELREVADVVRAWQREERNGFEPIRTVGNELWHEVQSVWIDDKSIGQNDARNLLLEVVGPWGEKLRVHGLVHELVRERRFNFQADSERHIDENGSGTHVIRTIVFRDGYIQLVELIERALKTVDASNINGS